MAQKLKKALESPLTSTFFFGYNRCQMYSCWLNKNCSRNHFVTVQMRKNWRTSTKKLFTSLVSAYWTLWIYSTLLTHFQSWINTGMVSSDAFSVQRYVSTIQEKNQCRSISFETKHISRRFFVSITCIYWVQKKITLINSWCMQFFIVKNDTERIWFGT